VTTPHSSPTEANLWRDVETAHRPETIGRLIVEAADRFGDKLMFEFFDTARTLSFRELADRSERVAAALERRGIRRGDHVAVMLLNDPEFPIVFCALARIGAVMVSLNTRSSAGELDHIISDADVTALVIDASFLDTLAASKFADAFTGRLVVANQDGHATVEHTGVDLADLLTETAPLEEPDVQTTDPVTILYTSGSTGMPKGCVHSHLYWLVLAQSSAGHREEASRHLADSPFFYMTGPGSTCGALLHGGAVVMPRRPSMSKFMTWVREHAITSAWVTVLQLADPPHPDDRNHNIRFAPTDDIPGDRIAEFEERFAIAARHLYAMTEIGVGTIVPDDAEEMARSGSIGIPGPFRECMIVDEDCNPITTAAAAGEMCVRGLGLFDGYYKQTDANASSFLPGGWFRTGDLVRRDERGWYYFLGRIKDIVRRAGENISATEVESAIEAIADVAKAVVVPVPDEKRGEEVKAYIVLKASRDSNDLPPATIVEQLRGQIADYKIPRYFEYRTTLPRTDSDKISKRALLAERSDLREQSFDRVDNVWR
jgi:crotonobetaine/carnitine-CoA ligase